MAGRVCVIFPEQEAWRVGVIVDGRAKIVRSDAAVDAPMAVKVARTLALVDARTVLIALPSADCLTTSIDTHGLPHRHRREAMLYRMEEGLPLPVEEVTADFVTHNGRALGVCTQTVFVTGLIGAFEQAGCRVAAVVPAAMLVCSGSIPARNAGGNGDANRFGLLWQSDETVELVFTTENVPTEWYTLPADARDIRLVLETRADAAPTRLTARVSDSVLVDSLRDRVEIDFERCGPDTFYEAATLAGDAIARGRERAVVDLQPGAAELAGGDPRLRRPIVAAVMAVMLFLVVTACALLWRAEQYHRLAIHHDAERLAIFQRIFPGQPVPVGIRSRLASVEQSMHRPGAGERGSAVMVIQQVLSHLPAELRFRIDQMEFTPNHLTLQGEAPSHTDAEALANALRNARELEIEEPQTRQVNAETIGFTLAGATRKTPAKEPR